MSIESTMIDYYAKRAQEYERIYQKPERQADLRQLRGFVERTFADADVFELACGTGYVNKRRAVPRIAALVKPLVSALCVVFSCGGLNAQTNEGTPDSSTALGSSLRQLDVLICRENQTPALCRGSVTSC
jgi:hypothetical protein